MTETLAIDDILKSTNGLINSIISKYSKYYEYDDLYQVASIAVLTAYQNYDSSYGTKFSTYAYKTILGEVRKYASQNRGLKVSSDYRALGKKLDEAREVLTQKLMKKPSTLELSRFTGVPESIIDDVWIANRELDSLDRTISEDGKQLTLIDTIGGSSNIPTEDELMLHSAISRLPIEEQKIIDLTYFKDYTQDRVATDMGITQVQVSRNLKRTKSRLRDMLTKVA